MFRQYAIKIQFQGEEYVSTRRFTNFDEARDWGREHLKQNTQWDVETLHSTRPFEET